MRRSASVIIEVIAFFFVVGLVAVVAIPDHKEPSPDPQYRSLIAALERVRTGIDRYWGDHEASFPSMEAMGMLAMPPAGPRTRTGMHRYLDRVPVNPYSGGNRVAGFDTPVGQSDWVYDPVIGSFKANDSAENRAL